MIYFEEYQDAFNDLRKVQQRIKADSDYLKNSSHQWRAISLGTFVGKCYQYLEAMTAALSETLDVLRETRGSIDFSKVSAEPSNWLYLDKKGKTKLSIGLIHKNWVVSGPGGAVSVHIPAIRNKKRVEDALDGIVVPMNEAQRSATNDDPRALLDLVEAHLAASLKQAKKWSMEISQKTKKSGLPLMFEVLEALEKADAEAAAAVEQAIQGQPPPTPGALQLPKSSVHSKEQP